MFMLDTSFSFTSSQPDIHSTKCCEVSLPLLVLFVSYEEVLISVMQTETQEVFCWPPGDLCVLRLQ